MRREMEDMKNDSPLQSLGKNNTTTVLSQSVGTTVGERSGTPGHLRSQ